VFEANPWRNDRAASRVCAAASRCVGGRERWTACV